MTLCYEAAQMGSLLPSHDGATFDTMAAAAVLLIKIIPAAAVSGVDDNRLRRLRGDSWRRGLTASQKHALRQIPRSLLECSIDL